jgi:hypothetical protein
MKVGESVLLPDDYAKQPYGEVTYAQRAVGGGAKFTMRKTTEGYRIWRVS